VRATLRARLGDEVARQLPAGFQRLGSVLLLRLPDGLRRHYPAIGEAWREELGVRTVYVRTGPVVGEFRRPSVEAIAGGGGETEFSENGIRFRLDAARLMFAEGNQGERRRFGALVRPGETFVDLFAGIGYFTLPGLVHGGAARAFAVEKNPLSFRYLVENLELNRVAGRATALLGDNRDAPLPLGQADRVVLGYLPSSLPWLGRAVALLTPDGGWLHVHLLTDTRAGSAGAEARVREAIEGTGGACERLVGREVKPYGPGRAHAVVDAWVIPRGR
jgi:tRNA wybutosine-synthesizing protein 2